jgi:paired small multidrug resistance pump
MPCHGRIKAWEVTVQQYLSGFFKFNKLELFEMNRNWIKVLIAAFFEVFLVIGLAHAYDFWTWTGTFIYIILSNYLMITAGQILPAGTVYTVFVGLGTAGIVISEILFLGEPFRWKKTLLILILLIGVVGLKLVTDNSDNKVEEGAEP